MNAYKTTIGLEIHAELKTASKMFCNSKNDADELRANVNICPVCMAHPGTLPVINRQAVAHVLRVGLALGSTLADYTEFDRKNYFYPDLPKGYQLSQFEYPLVSGGSLNGVQLTRIHLEEDTASSTHNDTTGATLIDYNRAGIPLMELVTDPVIHSAAQAVAFGQELQLLLRTLGVSDADMEKGQMRLEANVSISATEILGTKVELKNINSFRAMERAVEYEIKRHQELLDEGKSIVQETRGWDDAKQQTFSQRVKEGSADYRYFPDPDLPSLRLSELAEYNSESLRKTLPQLPWDKRIRYKAFGIRDEDAELYVQNKMYERFFDDVLSVLGERPESIKVASNYIANDLVSIIRDMSERDTQTGQIIPISAKNFAKIIALFQEKKISSRSAKDILLVCCDGGTDPEVYAKEKGLYQELDTSKLKETIEKIISDNPAVVQDYKAGKAPALEYLVGQCMKALRGAADATSIRDMLRQVLDS